LVIGLPLCAIGLPACRLPARAMPGSAGLDAPKNRIPRISDLYRASGEWQLMTDLLWGRLATCGRLVIGLPLCAIGLLACRLPARAMPGSVGLDAPKTASLESVTYTELPESGD
jgi:hypothetical protein